MILLMYYIFEPIDFEHVRSVIEQEQPDGIIVHFGGQTPLKLANAIHKFWWKNHRNNC